MTRRSLALFAVMFPAAYVFGGPFGLEMGQSMDGIPIEQNDKSNPYLYLTYNVPKPHSAFELYALLSPPATGLCQIRAIGKDVATSVYGSELRSQFEKIRDQISKVYGTANTADQLRSGSIWDEPNEWMTALRKKERILQASWDKESGANLKDNITEILLTAAAQSNSKGHLLLQYSFTNTAKCNEAVSQEESDAF